MFKLVNPNPTGKYVSDCVVRALCIAQGQSWDKVYIDLCGVGFDMGDWGSSNAVWGAYLRDNGYRRYIIPNNCPDCYTVKQFCIDHPKGTFVLATGTHVVAVVDGDYCDTWDSGNEIPIYYWLKEE